MSKFEVNNFVYKFLLSALKQSERSQRYSLLNDCLFWNLLKEDSFIKVKAPRQSGHTTAMTEIINKFCQSRKTLVITMNRTLQEFIQKRYELENNNVRFETVFTLSNKRYYDLSQNFQFVFFDCTTFAENANFVLVDFYEYLNLCANNLWSKKEPFFYVELE